VRKKNVHFTPLFFRFTPYWLFFVSFSFSKPLLICVAIFFQKPRKIKNKKWDLRRLKNISEKYKSKNILGQNL
jgi:hypothetical protein